MQMDAIQCSMLILRAAMLARCAQRRLAAATYEPIGVACYQISNKLLSRSASRPLAGIVTIHRAVPYLCHNTVQVSVAFEETSCAVPN